MSDDAKFLQAVTFARSGKFDRANELFAKLAAKYPANAQLAIAYARSLGLAFDYENARQQLERILKSQPDNAALWIEIATCEEDWDRVEWALKSWQRATQAKDAPAGTWVELARVYERLNRPEEALEALAKTEAKSAARLAVEGRLAFRAGEFSKAAAGYEELSRRAADPDLRQRGFLCLAKIAEAGGDFAAAWKFILQAKAAVAALAETMKHSTPMPDFAELPPLDGEEDEPSKVAFLLGFPRSGTSLAGQLLAKRPGFVYGDETLVASNAFNCISQPENPANWANSELDAARNHFLKSIDRLGGLQPGNQWLDKNPALSLWAPLLATLFPAAPIFWCDRDPRDVFMSCFTTDFRVNGFTGHFNRAEDLAALIKRTATLADRLESAIPELFHRISYESLVTEKKLPETLDFLGDDGASERPKFVNSPTYFEVTQPITSDRIGRWEGYREWLGPVFDELV